jgi:hypothetical protein
MHWAKSAALPVFMYEIAQRTAFSSLANWCGTRLTYKSHDVRKARPLDRDPSNSFGGAGLSFESEVPEFRVMVGDVSAGTVPLSFCKIWAC